jgi:hypothetical protein
MYSLKTVFGSIAQLTHILAVGEKQKKGQDG